jgi:hypothetical protein
MILCRNKEGMILSEEVDILRRWAEPSNQNTINQETYQVFPATDELIPTFGEVKNTTQKLKDNKAPGIDLIQAELIKEANPDFVEHVHQLIIKIWTTETIPED